MPNPSRRSQWLRWLGYAASLALVAWLLFAVLPGFGDLGRAGSLLAERLGPADLALIGVILGCYLLTQALTLTTALPALPLRSAVLLRAVSSGVSRLVPAGWTASTGTLGALLRVHGASGDQIARGLLVTGVWNVLTKLSLPLVGVAGIALVGATALADGGTVVALALTALAATLVALRVLARERVARWVGGVLQRPVGLIARTLGRRSPRSLGDRTAALQQSVVEAMQARPLAMASWYYVHHLTRVALVWTGMRVAAGATGLQVGALEVFTAFAVGYLLTGLPFAPGGLGTLDVAFVATAVALGEDGTVAAAGLIVYRSGQYGLYAAAVVGWLVWRGLGRPVGARGRRPLEG
jgi:hypothetical protein